MTRKEEKLQELLDVLKEEIFLELDQRMKKTEHQLGGQIKNVDHKLQDVDQRVEDVNQLVETEVARQLKPWRKKVYGRIHYELQEFQKGVKLYYRIPYMIMVASGFMLFWYGSFRVLPTIPLFEDGFIAMLTGLALLIITGAAYKKLVG